MTVMVLLLTTMTSYMHANHIYLRHGPLNKRPAHAIVTSTHVCVTELNQHSTCGQW